MSVSKTKKTIRLSIWYFVFCQLKYNSKKPLDHHIKKVHEGLKYECHECNGLFCSIQGVKKHVNMVHKGLTYDCDICESKYVDRSGLSTHKKNVHFKGTVYGANTLTATIFAMMTQLNTGWKCIQCGKETKHKASLETHIESDHMGISHTCKMCWHTYKTKDTFRNHLQTSDCKAKNLAIADHGQ